MADCRVELFAEATDYDPIVVIGEMGHVAGASDDGPRARAELSAAERNDYENLILLCRNCHEKIDGQESFYTDERLRDIKQAHEAWVRASLPERGRSSTGWTVLGLYGYHPIDLATAGEALSPDFISGDIQMLQVPTNATNWQAVDAAISSRVREMLSGPDVFDRRLAIFPLAPVSACLSLGYHLTSRPHVRLLQQHRDQNSWAWPRRSAPAQDIMVSGVDGLSVSNARAVAFLFQFSAEITEVPLADVVPTSTPRIQFRVTDPGTGWLVHHDQVTWAATEARQTFERAMRMFPSAEMWHFFFAGPASVAVAIGQQLNPTMYPATQLYEYRHQASPRYLESILLTVCR
jgi:hypothetical protein